MRTANRVTITGVALCHKYVGPLCYKRLRQLRPECSYTVCGICDFMEQCRRWEADRRQFGQQTHFRVCSGVGRFFFWRPGRVLTMPAPILKL
jgi:hypothetical protein